MGSIITVLISGISAIFIAPSAISFVGAMAQRRAAEQQANYEALLRSNTEYVQHRRKG